MEKIIFVLALAMVYATNVNAIVVPTHGGGVNDAVVVNSGSSNSGSSSDVVDCVRYDGTQAKAATTADNNNSFSAVYSLSAERKGGTNKDCQKASAPASGGSSGGNTVVPTHAGGSND